MAGFIGKQALLALNCGEELPYDWEQKMEI